MYFFHTTGIHYIKKHSTAADAYLKEHFPRIHHWLHRYQIGIKYVVSGGIAAIADLAILYTLTDILGVWYLYSTIFAYVGSFFIAFGLQKFWTFSDADTTRMKKQLFMYGMVALVDFLLNPVIMYFLVSMLTVWYMFAQIITSGILAIGNFIFNKTVTFKNPNNEYR